MKKILNILDKFICSYIGIRTEKTTPICFKRIDNCFLISKTESFKRHLYVKKMEDFFTTDLKEMSRIDKKKLGLAIGKTIAKNLTISFDEIIITRESSSA